MVSHIFAVITISLLPLTTENSAYLNTLNILRIIRVQLYYNYDQL